jgi:hypothetical protein
MQNSPDGKSGEFFHLSRSNAGVQCSPLQPNHKFLYNTRRTIKTWGNYAKSVPFLVGATFDEKTVGFSQFLAAFVLKT